jgi:hypothetical protein
MSAEHPTEFNVNGLVIFDLNDLPEVTIEEDRFVAGNTTIPRTGASLSYEELKSKAQELYAIALAVRDQHMSPEMELMIEVILANSDHNAEEAREIALGMLGNGVYLDA